MKLLLTHSPGIGSNLVSAFTFSQFSHVDLMVAPGKVIGATPKNGVALSSADARIKDASHAVVMDVPTTGDDDLLLRSWLNQQLGKPYDWSALIGTFVFRRDWTEDDKWFCSELAASAFSVIGKPIVYADMFSRVTPGMIEMLPFKREVIK